MKKSKIILIIVGIIVVLLLMTLLAIRISITRKYDGKEVELIKTKDATVYLTDIKYDEEKGPQIYCRLDQKTENNGYNMKMTTRKINGVRLYSFESVGFPCMPVNLYNFYKVDMDALNLKTNKEKLEKYGYTIEDYKTAFSNINSFELEIELYEWIYPQEEYNSNYDGDVDIDLARGYEKKIGSTYRIIKVNENANNLLKKLYKTIKIKQRTKIAKSIEEENWKNFDEIVPSDIIEKIDRATREKDDLKIDVLLQQLRNKKYAEYTEETEISKEHAAEKQKYQMWDKDGNLVLTITPYYVSSTTAVPVKYYEITYQDKLAYYTVKD